MEGDRMDKITVFVQIGNSDDKLTQARWSDYVGDVEFVLRHLTKHFAGLAAGDRPWQNACWCVEVPLNQRDPIRARLAKAAAEFDQDSIAWAEAQTTFIEAAK
jgi:hypothetical protein